MSPDFPALPGHTALVTGATAGIGREVALRLAGRGLHVYATGRDEARGAALCAEAESAGAAGDIVFQAADLADFSAVRGLARAVLEHWSRLDLLILNAGGYWAELERNAEGLEMTAAVNHLGHFLLTSQLVQRLRGARGRVIVLSSEAHRAVSLDGPMEPVLRGDAHRYHGMRAYGRAKLMNLLFTFELARRTSGRGLVAHAVHPGTLATRIWNRNDDFASRVMRVFKPLLGAPGRGADAVLHAALDPRLGRLTGLYLKGTQVGRASRSARDERRARELWGVSERLTGTEPWP